MNKKSFAGLMVGALAVSAVAVAMPQTVAAADVNPSIRMEGSVQSMVLSMRQVAGVFLAKYPNSAVHSISLKPDRGRFYYEVITGNIIKEKSDKKEKDIPSKVFNPNNVIDSKKAEAIAVTNIGGDAISKGWKLEADAGKVQYEVTIYHNDEKDGLVQQGVIMDAVTGDVITRTLPEKVVIPDEEDDGFILWGE